MSLIEKLGRRYASKQMNGQKLPAEKVENILESIRLAPTSMGLQPFTIFVVTDQSLKQQIFDKAAPGQPQIPMSSELLIFACFKQMTTEILDANFDRIRHYRPMLPLEKVVAYRNMMNFLLKQSPEQNFNWAARQAYIALGFALATAAYEEVDSVPIEGFNPAALDELMNFADQNLGSVCMMAIGYRNEETDYNARLPKVRKTTDELFRFL
jgi:nitroreductase